MAIADDFSVAANGDIRYTGTTANYTVLELHRFLQDLADDASGSGDDLLDITDTSPSTRSTNQIITLNSPYNVDDTAVQHLYGGSISQDNGDTLYSGLRVIGTVNLASTELMVVQNGAALTSFWGTGLNDSDAGTLLRIMVKTRTGGSDIDGKRVRVQAREWGDTYDQFDLTLGDGESVAAINTADDGNNDSTTGTIASLVAGVSLTFGLATKDLNNGNGSLEYALVSDLNTETVANFYEITKYITRRGETTSYNGMQGQLLQGVYTHSFAYDNESGGPFTEGETLTFGNGATAVLTALDDDGATGNMYVHLLTGAAPADNDTITGGTSSATADINGAVTSLTAIKTGGPLGTFAGGTFFGARGHWVEDMDSNDTQKISLTDLAGATQTPPNSVGITVNGLVSGDRVLVARDDGSGGVDEDTYSLAAGNNSGNGTLVIAETINSDDPASGFVRVQNPTSGTYDRYEYTSYSGSTFTLSGTLSTNYTASDNVFVPFIDEASTGTSVSSTIIQSTDINVVARVRNGGGSPIVPFETTGTIGAAGLSITAIRTSDA